MFEENTVTFDASQIGRGKIQLSPTQGDARSALKFLKVEAELEAEINKMDKGNQPEAVSALNLIELEMKLLDYANGFDTEILQLTDEERAKLGSLSMPNCLIFSIKLAQAVLGMEDTQKGNQKSE